MNDFQQIKRLLLPALKGLPVIGLCVVIAIAIAYRINLYTNPVYESTIKIKLDDINQGVSSAELYANFDVFAHTNKIATEVEMLKSKLLIERTIDKLDFGTSYYRKGKIRTQELYNNNPFVVEASLKDTRLYNQAFQLVIVSESHFVLQLPVEGISIEGRFGELISTDRFELTITRNENFLNSKVQVDFVDEYQFKIHNRDYIVNTMIGANLDVIEVDQDVAVIRVSFKSEVPEKTALFVNTLGKSYVDDYIESRTTAAGKTVDFIDEQLKRVSKELRDSESRLEAYKTENNIINTRQETETDLRKIAQLKIQLSNLNMNEVALDSLERYINENGDRFLELAPNFEAYNDLLSTELIKKIKFYQSEKRDLLLKYTPDDEKVKVVDDKIADVVVYIKESIRNSSKSIRIKRIEIEKAIEEANKVFIGLPTKEKELVILNRDFTLNQKIFNFLTEKKTEASIAEAASISFHRIIQTAYVPTQPISPKKTLTMIVMFFLGLIIGISIVYLKEFIGGKIRSRDALEKISTLPVAGVVRSYKRRKQDKKEDFLTLGTNLQMLHNIQKHQALLVTSTIAREGKTFVARHLAEAYAGLGWKVVIVDLNFKQPSLHTLFGKNNQIGISDLVQGKEELKNAIHQEVEPNLSLITTGRLTARPIQLINSESFKSKINELKEEYDLVLIDAPATAFGLESIKLMEYCEQVYYVVRANFTKSHFLLNADLIANEYDFEHMNLILNDVHQASNFNGNYTGSQFSYETDGMKFFNRLKHYISYYL